LKIPLKKGKRLVKLKIDNMNLQENINRIQEMMGIINEDSNMKEMIFDVINDEVKGADLYENKGSLWLIFTDDKEWVIKLNKEGYLWYNYNFFNSIFKYLSLDVVENQHYITEWVEDTIKNGVKYTRISTRDIPQFIEDTIKNGVKYTIYDFKGSNIPVEDTIKNGVKYTIEHQKEAELTVEDTIKNGENLGKIKNR
jgi:hypothetical protein